MTTRRHTYRLKALVTAVALWELLFGAAFIGLNNFLDRVDGFQYERPSMLWGLLLIPLWTAGYLLALKWKNNAIRRFASLRLRPFLLPPVSALKTFLKYLLFRNGLFLLLIALANPQYGKGKNTAVAEGIEILLALDVSNSMRALDLHPQKDRLTVAKLSIDRLLHKLRGDKVGIVVFAGDAYVHVPLTSDYRAIRLFLSTIRPEMMTHQGTAIGRAIAKCIASFDKENGINKAIVLLSDGEDHEEKAVEMARSAREQQIVVSTVGMGTLGEVPIPEYRNGRITGLKKTADGQPVLTTVNEEMLLQVARAGGGAYTRAQGDFVNLEELLATVRKIEKTTIAATHYTDYEDRYDWLLAVGLVLVVADFFVTERRPVRGNRIKENNN